MFLTVLVCMDAWLCSIYEAQLPVGDVLNRLTHVCSCSSTIKAVRL